MPLIHTKAQDISRGWDELARWDRNWGGGSWVPGWVGDVRNALWPKFAWHTEA